MIENQFKTQTSWTIDEFPEKEPSKIIRKYINSAIYVEKTITDMTPSRKTSPLSASDEDASPKSTVRLNTAYISSKNSLGIKKNTSSSSSNSSQYRSSTDESKSSSLPKNNSEIGYDDSDVTVKPPNNDLRLSLTGLNSDRTDRISCLNLKEKEEIVQSWMLRKEQEKRQKELRETKLAKEKEEERQRIIEKERENFKKWLAAKKKEEERKRMEKELEEEQEKLKEAEKEKKRVENDINYTLWLRRKKKSDLERKIREKIALLHLYEEKQRRMEENERAYQDWLKNAQNRQKPVPMNKGLQSTNEHSVYNAID
ncbi:histone-lysine N-methyltransferase, H3 lysine-79 specific-like isoform X2 [Sitophilus oryzae]|uniref:Histone-lysine N-methyltransferase, H3 lysine-79 specific-like isoform X2 n=1 Tax=Sitophilus oryzae TaxID=7048 RepID=A0A6J2YD60_SITOR|nr:histone-lysine N-methyltransferase, H3 lysine-79 specific-like isoform X2 [Sitophilus oryzae]